MTDLEQQLKDKHDALQVGLAPDEICIREGIVLKICEESRFPFEFFCWRSPPMVKEMDCFVKYCRGREDFLDVGAYHGLFSMVFRKLNEHRLVIALEPSTESYSVLMKNMHANENAFGAANVSLSDYDGHLDMQFEDGHLVAQESRRFNVDSPCQSRCHTGDEFCATSKAKPDTIKIDVEGHEIKVLRGLQKTISELRPVIFLEIHPVRLAKQGDRLEEIKELLPNYRFIYTGTDEEADILNPPNSEPNEDPRFVCLPL